MVRLLMRLRKMNKIYVYVFIGVALMAFLKWGHAQVFDQGYNAHAKEVSDAKDSAIKEDIADVKTIIMWREKEKVVYRDKIEYIESVEDDTGCADTRLTDMGFGLQQ